MDTNQMNRQGCRPYCHSCGMFRTQMPVPEPERRRKPEPSMRMKDRDMYEHLKHLPPAMAYVPNQKFESAYDWNYALKVGTVFPQLCKPFCGKRGVCR